MKDLLLIECENKWLAPSGKLYSRMKDAAQFQTSHQNIKTALNTARQTGLLMLHSRLVSKLGHPELRKGNAGLRKAIPQSGTFVKGGFGDAFQQGFQPLESELVPKSRTRASAFAASNLEQLLLEKSVYSLILNKIWNPSNKNRMPSTGPS